MLSTLIASNDVKTVRKKSHKILKLIYLLLAA